MATETVFLAVTATFAVIAVIAGVVAVVALRQVRHLKSPKETRELTPADSDGLAVFVAEAEIVEEEVAEQVAAIRIVPVGAERDEPALGGAVARLSSPNVRIAIWWAGISHALRPESRDRITRIVKQEYRMRTKHRRKAARSAARAAHDPSRGGGWMNS